MKRLPFIPFLLITSLAFADMTPSPTMEISESSMHGPSYLDAYNNILTVNLQSSVANPDVALGANQCGTLIVEEKKVNGQLTETRRVDNTRTCEVATFSGCDRIEDPNDPSNDVALYVSFVDGKEVETRQQKPDCLAARKTEVLNNPRFCKDNESPTLIMTLQQQKTCNNGKACTQNTSTSVKSFPVPQSEVDRCSPQHQNVVVKSSQGGPSMIASFKQNEHCGKRFGQRQIRTGSLLWDQLSKPEYQIHVNDEGGFMLGDHTHYYYDFQRGHWCNHYLPTGRETCKASFMGATIPIAYSTATALAERNDRSTWRNQGVVKLEFVDGKPVATVGHATSEDFDENAKEGAILDETKPVLKVTLSDTSTAGRKALFELRDSNSADAKVHGRIDVSPTYSLGSEMSSPSKTCDANRCLNVASVLLPTITDKQLQCTNNHKLDLTTSTNLCYSCNGITSGLCGSTTTLINLEGNSKRSSVVNDPRTYRRIKDVRADLKSCGQTPPPAEAPSTTDI
jgi:hypothetical protein